MKVDSAKAGMASSLQQAGQTQANKSKASSTQAKSFSQTSASSQVDLSQRAQDLNKIRDLAFSAPDSNSAKVERLKSLIEKGEYKVDAKSVADRLVNEHFINDALEKGQHE